MQAAEAAQHVEGSWTSCSFELLGSPGGFPFGFQGFVWIWCVRLLQVLGASRFDDGRQVC